MCGRWNGEAGDPYILASLSRFNSSSYTSELMFHCVKEALGTDGLYRVGTRCSYAVVVMLEGQEQRVNSWTEVQAMSRLCGSVAKVHHRPFECQKSVDESK